MLVRASIHRRRHRRRDGGGFRPTRGRGRSGAPEAKSVRRALAAGGPDGDRRRVRQPRRSRSQDLGRCGSLRSALVDGPGPADARAFQQGGAGGRSQGAGRDVHPLRHSGQGRMDDGIRQGARRAPPATRRWTRWRGSRSGRRRSRSASGSPSCSPTSPRRRPRSISNGRRLRVSIPIAVNTSQQVLSGIADLDSAWRSYANAARYMLETKKDYDAGLKYADQSLALKEDWYTLLDQGLAARRPRATFGARATTARRPTGWRRSWVTRSCSTTSSGRTSPTGASGPATEQAHRAMSQPCESRSHACGLVRLASLSTAARRDGRGGAAAAARAARPPASPRTVGLTQITVEYNSPAVGGRRVWGRSSRRACCGEPAKRTGPQIRFSREVAVGGERVPAGTLRAAHHPLRRGDWTVILNRDAKPGGDRAITSPSSTSRGSRPARARAAPGAADVPVLRIHGRAGVPRPRVGGRGGSASRSRPSRASKSRRPSGSSTDSAPLRRHRPLFLRGEARPGGGPALHRPLAGLGAFRRRQRRSSRAAR